MNSFPDLFLLDDTLWVAAQKTQVALYDFAFSPLLPVSRPRSHAHGKTVARLGAIPDYAATWDMLAAEGFHLIHTPQQHDLASTLSGWYPLLREFTPRSQVWAQFPAEAEVLDQFRLPVFIKGTRQTARHEAGLSIARTREDLRRIREAYAQHPILHWQPVAIREYVPLMPVPAKAAGKVPVSFEFRSFWWRGALAGAGHYWAQYAQYTWTPQQQQEAMQVAEQCASRLNLPFVALDMALTAAGEWILIEVNDAQECGYAGVNRLALWQEILRLEGRA